MEKTFDDVIICPKCGGEDTYSYDTDELEFGYDGTGHYYADCACKACGNHFHLYTYFKYEIISSYTR